MTAALYWISKLVVIEWQLTGLDGAPINDATVTGTVALPDGTTAPATISHDAGTNIYRAAYDPVMAGRHAYRLVATGTGDSAEEGVFDVRASPSVGPAPTLDPSTTLGQLRLLIPDRDVTALVYSDADLEGFLALEGGVIKRATAAALETIAADEALVSKVIKTQDLSTDGTRVAEALMKRAARLREQADEDDVAAGSAFDIVDFADPYARRPPENTEFEVI